VTPPDDGSAPDADTLRVALKRLLGGWPDRPAPPAVTVGAVEKGDGFVLERLTVRHATGAEARGLLTRPPTPGPHPAVLYCHAHGGKYEIGASELIEPRPSLVSPYGPALARAGFVTLCVDMPTFGERLAPAESALAKRLLWHGDTLFGMMLRELAGGIDLLAARPDVDPERIAALGLSMGATQAFWLAALDARVARVAHLCCYADLETLVALGGHDRHGIYMMVPGLLAQASTGAIAGLVAPRPQLIALGDEDALTPPEAIAAALPATRAAYERAGAAGALEVIIEPGSGHQETPRMRDAVMRFLSAIRLA
jgi:dienelactone hydrolase